MAAFKPSLYWVPAILMVFACLGYGMSRAVYNSYLPILVGPLHPPPPPPPPPPFSFFCCLELTIPWSCPPPC